jgi:hypothetical protein
MVILARRKIHERVSDGCVHRREMTNVTRQHCRLMPTRRCSNGDIGKAWSMATAARQIGSSATSHADYDFRYSFRRGRCGNRCPFSVGMQDTWPRIERRHPSSNEFAGISGDYNEIFQGGNRRDEQIWLSKGVAMLLAFDHHRFPADNHVLGYGEDAVCKQRPKRSVEP